MGNRVYLCLMYTHIPTSLSSCVRFYLLLYTRLGKLFLEKKDRKRDQVRSLDIVVINGEEGLLLVLNGRWRGAENLAFEEAQRVTMAGKTATPSSHN